MTLTNFKNIFYKLKNHKLCIFKSKSLIDKYTNFSGKNYIGFMSRVRHSCLGFQSYIGDYSTLDNTIIGNYCCISHHVVVVQGKHPTKDFVSIHPAFFQKHYRFSYTQSDLFQSFDYLDNSKKIACIIGNDVWVGYGSLILSGVKIGDGAIIAAGSVVTKDVPPFSIVGGVPAKVIKKRFSDNQIDSLLRIRWWEKDEKWICDNCSYFGDIKNFLNNI